MDLTRSSTRRLASSPSSSALGMLGGSRARMTRRSRSNCSTSCRLATCGPESPGAIGTSMIFMFIPLPDVFPATPSCRLPGADRAVAPRRVGHDRSRRRRCGHLLHTHECSLPGLLADIDHRPGSNVGQLTLAVGRDVLLVELELDRLRV